MRSALPGVVIDVPDEKRGRREETRKVEALAERFRDDDLKTLGPTVCDVVVTVATARRRASTGSVEIISALVLSWV